MLNKEDLIRYSKQIQLSEIGKTGQQKLQSSKVLVIGAGGLGCPVLTQLTTCGIEQLASLITTKFHYLTYLDKLYTDIHPWVNLKSKKQLKDSFI